MRQAFLCSNWTIVITTFSDTVQIICLSIQWTSLPAISSCIWSLEYQNTHTSCEAKSQFRQHLKKRSQLFVHYFNNITFFSRYIVFRRDTFKKTRRNSSVIRSDSNNYFDPKKVRLNSPSKLFNSKNKVLPLKAPSPTDSTVCWTVSTIIVYV